MADSSHSRPLSSRFLTPKETRRGKPERAWSAGEIFAEGPWQAIRVQLERQGWNATQIELIHGQLRQGWPLAMATANVALMTGKCPLQARTRG